MSDEIKDHIIIRVIKFGGDFDEFEVYSITNAKKKLDEIKQDKDYNLVD